MATINELKGLIEESDYVGTTANDLARILRETVRKGETILDGASGFYVYGVDANKYHGLLTKLKLIESLGFGEYVIRYPLTERGLDLGKKLLEESHQTASSER